MTCTKCEREANWKVEDLALDTSLWACKEHLLELLPDSANSPVLTLVRVESLKVEVS